MVHSEKPVIAVDCDEVLAQFLPALIRYHNAKYSTTLELKDFHSYRFCEVWGGTNEEATEKIHDFFETDHFLRDLAPMPGALEVLESFKEKFTFVVVTSRQHIIEQATRDWLQNYFPNVFSDALFGNH
eukprot:gene19497-23314_t